jgi:hypothetical protein
MTRHSDCQPCLEFPCWRLATIYLHAVSPSKLSNISPASVVNSVTTRTKTTQYPNKDVTEFRVSWGSYADFGSFQTQKSVSDPCQAINWNDPAKSIHFAQFWVSLPHTPESRLFQRTNPRVLLQPVPFWLCHWVQVDGHVCFSVRNMTRDKVHVSKQNIPEYHEIRLICDYEDLCWSLLCILHFRPRTELTKYNFEKKPNGFREVLNAPRTHATWCSFRSG